MSDDRHTTSVPAPEGPTGHLTRERIAAVIDEPVLPGPVRDHLDACPECRHEHEQMSRMRMALSASGGLEPPEGQWERILARLEPAGGPAAVVPQLRKRRLEWLPTMLRVAAALVLTTAGLLAGFRLGGSGVGDDVGSPDEADLLAEAELPTLAEQPAGGEIGADAAAGAEMPAEYADVAVGGQLPAEYVDVAEGYLRAVGDIAMLRAGDWADSSAGGGPPAAEAMAARLARLDALASATREALQSAPADPVLNNLLFDLAAERSDLSNQLDETLHLATLEMY